LNHPDWKVVFHAEFVEEFKQFSPDVQDELLASAIVVKTLGPAAGRPHVGTLSNPRHPNMKELRFKANNGAEIWRAVFAFDPVQQAIMLVAADKQGIPQERFYKNLLKIANSRYEQHLATREKKKQCASPIRISISRGKHER